MPHKSGLDTHELIETRLHDLPEEKLLVDPELREAMILAQPLLAEDWLSAEEDEAWAYLTNKKIREGGY